MNLPNKLTIFRIVLIPLYIFFVTTNIIPYTNMIALIVFLLASVTDFLDGFIARKKNIITDFGRLMDPLADKMLVVAALIIMASQGLVNAVFVVIIISRDFIVNSVRLIAASEGKVIAADIYGKIKTVFQMVAIIVILLRQALSEIKMGFDFNSLKYLGDILIWLSVILTVLSAINYIIKNREYFKIK